MYEKYHVVDRYNDSKRHFGRLLMLWLVATTAALCVYQLLDLVWLATGLIVVAVVGSFVWRDLDSEPEDIPAIIVVNDNFSHGSKCIWQMDREA